MVKMNAAVLPSNQDDSKNSFLDLLRIDNLSNPQYDLSIKNLAKTKMENQINFYIPNN